MVPSHSGGDDLVGSFVRIKSFGLALVSAMKSWISFKARGDKRAIAGPVRGTVVDDDVDGQFRSAGETLHAAPA
jgi:hypothetical protein